MATAIRSITREVSAVVLDLATTRQRIASVSAEVTQFGEDDAKLTAWDQLDDRAHALENELKAAIYAQTGVSWDLLEGVMA